MPCYYSRSVLQAVLDLSKAKQFQYHCPARAERMCVRARGVCVCVILPDGRTLSRDKALSFKSLILKL